MTAKYSSVRAELIYLLTWASELEHSLACAYLYASMSLKSDAKEGGMTTDEAAKVLGWKKHLANVAVDEMEHLAQVANLLTAIGGAPHFDHKPFPQPARTYPLGYTIELAPFTPTIAARFVAYEMPEAGILGLEEERIWAKVGLTARLVDPWPAKAFHEGAVHVLEPYMAQFTTVAGLYRRIEELIDSVSPTPLFLVGAENQASPAFLQLKGDLLTVENAAEAHKAIERIIEQGEVPTKEHPDAHFWVFKQIYSDYEDMRDQNSGFQPLRAVCRNPATRNQPTVIAPTLIHAGHTEEVAEVFNSTYDTLLLTLYRLFMHVEESPAELKHLADTALKLMSRVISPLGNALTKLPQSEGKLLRAGPTFGYGEDIAFLPHKRPAMVVIGERLRTAAQTAETLLGPTTPPELQEAVAGLQMAAVSF